MNRRAVLFTFTLTALGLAPAAAQTFPSKAVTIVVPFAAGGPTDVVGRIIAERMSRNLGQPVLIENIVGASGTTGALRVAQAAPDGHTILIGHTGTHAASVALQPNLRYDPVTDFTPVGLINTNPILVVSKNALPAANLKEFTAYLKANADKVNNAHAGIGSVSHTTCLLFNSTLGIKPAGIAYRGTGPAMNDIVGGQVDYLCDQITNVAPQSKAGAIRAYAIAQKTRSPILPDVPTTTEAGMPEFQVVVWNAMFLPKGTPPAITQRINEALRETLKDEATSKKLIDLGAEIPPDNLLSPQGLEAFIKSEIARWTPIIKAAGVVAN